MEESILNLLRKRVNRPVFIWGSGSAGIRIFTFLEEIGVQVEGFIDSDPIKHGMTVNSITIYSPDALKKSNYANKPFVVIASMYRGEIEAQLKKLGFDIKNDCWNNTGKFTESAPNGTPENIYDWFNNTILNSPYLPPLDVTLGTSLPWDHHCLYEARIAVRMAEMRYVEQVIFPENIIKNNVSGAVLEFGVFTGYWLERLYNICELHKMNCDVIGFDSFEGLPAKDKLNDFSTWQEGMYKADYETVAKRLKISERKNLKLFKGWFSDTFRLKEVRKIDKIAFARIDCDIYRPALECLEFIEDRLVEGAIVVFDDWSWTFKGEALALYEHLKKSQWNFKFLFYIDHVHLYFSVHKKE